MAMLIYSVDGGVTWLAAPEGVRVAVGSSGLPDLHINVTHEGVIIDAVLGDQVVATSCEDFDQIVDSLL
jgi:hypothetical protein